MKFKKKHFVFCFFVLYVDSGNFVCSAELTASLTQKFLYQFSYLNLQTNKRIKKHVGFVTPERNDFKVQKLS